MKKLLYVVDVILIDVFGSGEYETPMNIMKLTVKAEDIFDAKKKAKGILGKKFLDEDYDPKMAEGFKYIPIRLREDKLIIYNDWNDKMTDKEIKDEISFISKEINDEKFNDIYTEEFNNQLAKYNMGVISLETFFDRMYISEKNGQLIYDFRKWNKDFEIDRKYDTRVFDWILE